MSRVASAGTTIRVVAHVHSDWSYDGSWPLERLARAFTKRGYRAILMAEHDRGFDDARWAAYREACAVASTEEILFVPGIEYSDADNIVHVPVWGPIPFLGENLETASMLPAAHELGGLAVFAHPRRKQAYARFDPSWFRYLTGIELWNRRYDGYAPNRDVAILLRSNPELVPFASLDFHTTRHFHPLAMALELQGAVTEEAILAAIGARRARPMAFGQPAGALASWPAWPVMRSVDVARRAGLKTARRARAEVRRRASSVRADH
jgi:hypothetical protein